VNPWYYSVRGLAHLLLNASCGIAYRGREHVPAKGGLLVVSNHISFLDPPMVACAMPREIHFLARKTLFKKNGFGAAIASLNAIPINQERPDMNGLRIIIKRLKEGNAVLLFPEGERTWDGKLKAPAPGAGLVACKAGVPILPVRIFGSHEALPRGGKKFTRHPLRVVIGQPFLPEFKELAKQGKGAYDGVSRLMMEKIAELS